MFYFENVDKVSVINQVSTFEQEENNRESNYCSTTRLIDLVLNHYTECLLNNKAALMVLASRGLSDPSMISEFRIGYADRSLGLLLQKLGRFDQDATRGNLQMLGLLKPSGHEFFRGSLVFPFIDELGQVTGGYGRRVGSKLKSGPVYHVHWNPANIVFFNQKALENHKRIILCKTPIEALSFWVLGFQNVVSTLGLRQSNENHILALKRNNVEEVLFAFDNNKEGSRATRLVLQVLCAFDIKCKRIPYPTEKDANDCLLFSQKSRTYFTGLVNKAKPSRQTFSGICQDKK